MPHALLSLALVTSALLVIALRRPRDARRALLEIGRRPGRAVLLACALAPPTAIIVGALGAVDSATATARAIAIARSGGVDAVVVLNPLPPDPADRFDLTTGNPFGGYAATERGFFPEGEHARLAGATRESEAIAAIAPAIADDVAVLDGTGTRPLATVALLALDAPDTGAFGTIAARDGRPLQLAALPPDSVVINAAAAAVLGSDQGARLRLRLDRGPLAGWDVRVAAVVADGDIGGVQPLMLAPLARVQALTGQQGQINHLLVANRGGATNAASAEAASRELRWLLVDREQADRLRAALAQPEAQVVLERAARSTNGRERDQLLAVRAEARTPTTTERFVWLVSELYLRKRLVALSDGIRDVDLRRAVFASLTNLNTLSLVERGDEGTAGAAAYARAAAGGPLALVGVALGLAAALGWAASARRLARRRDGRARLFLLGAFHALGGAAIGAAAGIGGLWAASALLAEPARTAGIRPALDIAPGDVAAGTAGGLCLALLTIGAVASLRGRSRTAARFLGGDAGARALTVIPLASAAALAAVVGAGWQRSLLGPTLISCALLGGVGILRALPRDRGATGRGWLTPIAAAAAAGVWVQVLAGLPSPVATDTENIAAALLGGGAALFAGRWAVAAGLDTALAARGRPARVPAPGRLAGVCIGIVTLATAAALALGASLTAAFVAERQGVGGFDLRVDPADPTAGMARDGEALDRALREVGAGDRARIAGIGEVVRADVRVAAGAPPVDWRAMPLGGADEGLLAGLAAPFIQRAPGLDSDAAVWAALRERPNTAVISQQALRGLPGPAGGGVAPTLPFPLALQPAGGDAGEVMVIGVIDPRAALDPGLYVARARFDAAGATPASVAWFVAARPGAATALADALRPALAGHGFALSVPNDRQRVGDAARTALGRAVLAFLALALLACVAIAAGEAGRIPPLRSWPVLGPAPARARFRVYPAAAAGLLAFAEVGLGVWLGVRLASALAAVLTATGAPQDLAFSRAHLVAIVLPGWLVALGTLPRGGEFARPEPAD